jgi:signal peptidase I
MKAVSMTEATVHQVRPARRVIANSLFWVVLAFTLFLAYGNLPNRWYHVLYISSGSMVPAIQPGDLIIITPRPVVLKPGMILTLSVNGHLVTHRLVGFGEFGEPITQGDANSVADHWDNAAVSVVGVYRARIPYLGYLAVLPGRLAAVLPSGAWFSADHEMPGAISADSYWPAWRPVELQGRLAAWPFLETNQYGVALEVCLTNAGQDRIEGLRLMSRILHQDAAGGLSEVLSASLADGDTIALAPGEEECYQGRFKLAPLDGMRYQAIVHVLVPPSASEDSESVAVAGTDLVALELTADFEFDPASSPIPEPREATSVLATPALPPASPTPLLDTPAPLPLPTDTSTPPTPTGTTLGALLTDITVAAANDGRYSVSAPVCAQNTGSQPTEGLAIAAQVQVRVSDSAYVDLLEASLSFVPPGPLAPGALECFPIEITFVPMPGAHYHLAVRVTIGNHSGWLPGEPVCPDASACPFGPGVQAAFELPATAEAPSPTSEPATLEPAHDTTAPQP